MIARDGVDEVALSHDDLRLGIGRVGLSFVQEIIRREDRGESRITRLSRCPPVDAVVVGVLLSVDEGAEQILLWACSPYMKVLLVPSVIAAMLTGGKLAVPPAITLPLWPKIPCIVPSIGVVVPVDQRRRQLPA